MSLLFSHWKDEESFEEKYNKIFGSDKQGRSLAELENDIENSLNNNFTSRSERKQLLKIQEEINNSRQS